MFTLCTLKAGGSDIAKKQEIGRGLRLPVDNTGNRCIDRRINELTVIAMKGGNSMDQKKIGRFLKELRKEKVITQEQLAEKIKVSGRTVSRWETGV